MARSQQSSCGRREPSLDRLDPSGMRAALNAALDGYGIPHNAKAACHSLGRNRRPIVDTEIEDEEPGEFLE